MRFETLGDEVALWISRVKIYPSETTDSLTLLYSKRAETTCPAQQELAVSLGLGKETTLPIEIQSWC